MYAFENEGGEFLKFVTFPRTRSYFVPGTNATTPTVEMLETQGTF
jgi:hypothetical protein